MKNKTSQELYNETVEHILKYLDPNRFDEYRRRIREERRRDFDVDTRGVKVPGETKNYFEQMLKQYIIEITTAHNYFVTNNGTRSWNENNHRWSISIGSEEARTEFKKMIDRAHQSNIQLYNFENDVSLSAQHSMIDNDLAKDKRNEAIKSGVKRGLGVAALVGGAALATAAVIGTKNALEKSSDNSNETDKTPNMVQHEENRRTYEGEGQTWYMDGNSAIRNMQQRQQSQTVVEEEEVHESTEEVTQPNVIVEETEEIYAQPQPVTHVKKVVHVPAPQPVVHETIEEIQEQVEQNTVAYQTVVRPRVRQVQTVVEPTTTVVAAPTIVQPVDNTVKVAALNNLGNVGVAAVNAWGNIGTAKYLSRKGPDVVNITKIDDHSVRGSYNDNSVRVKKDSHNRTTVDASSRTYAPTTVDASRRTYAPTTTTVDASRRTYAPTTTKVDNSSHIRQTRVQKTQVQQTRIQQQTCVRQPQVNNHRTSSSCTTVRTRGSSSSMRSTMSRSSQKGSRVIQSRGSRRSTTPTRTNTTRRNSGGRGGSPMRRGR